MKIATIAALASLAAVPAWGQHLPDYGRQKQEPRPPQRQQRDLAVVGADGRQQVIEVDRDATDAEVYAAVQDARRRMAQRRP